MKSMIHREHCNFRAAVSNLVTSKASSQVFSLPAKMHKVGLGAKMGFVSQPASHFIGNCANHSWLYLKVTDATDLKKI